MCPPLRQPTLHSSLMTSLPPGVVTSMGGSAASRGRSPTPVRFSPVSGPCRSPGRFTSSTKVRMRSMSVLFPLPSLSLFFYFLPPRGGRGMKSKAEHAFVSNILGPTHVVPGSTKSLPHFGSPVSKHSRGGGFEIYYCWCPRLSFSPAALHLRCGPFASSVVCVVNTPSGQNEAQVRILRSKWTGNPWLCHVLWLHGAV